MSEPLLIVRSQRVVTSTGIAPAAIHIRAGRIERVAAWDDVPAGAHVDDVGDLAVMPGIVDTHVHLNEPGRTEWEGFATATRAAATATATARAPAATESFAGTWPPPASSGCTPGTAAACCSWRRRARAADAGEERSTGVRARSATETRRCAPRNTRQSLVMVAHGYKKRHGRRRHCAQRRAYGRKQRAQRKCASARDARFVV